jgi:uncharacterized coiled-coil DUF342 family protein
MSLKEKSGPRSSAPKASFAPRIPGVDKKAYDDKIEALEAQLKALQAKQTGVNKTVSEKTGGKEEFMRQRDLAKAVVDEASKVVEQLEAAKNKTQETMNTKVKSGQEQHAELNAMTKHIGFKSEKEINEKIARIEYQMQTETLDLKRERDLIVELSKLKQLKPQLLKLKNLKTGASVDDSVGSLRAELSDVQKKLSDARDEKRKASNALGKIIEARKKAMEGVSDLVGERDDLWQNIKKIQTELKAIKDEKFSKIREFQVQLAKAKIDRADREKIEKAYKDAESTRRRLEDELVNADVLPFSDQVELAENTVKYCAKLVPEVKVEEEKKVFEVKEMADVSKVFMSKSERAETFFVVPKKVKSVVAAKSVEVKSFTHSLDTLGLFATLKIDAPAGPKDVEKTVAALKTKIADLKKKQLDVVADRKAKRSEKEAALAEATKVAEAAKAEFLIVSPESA